MEERCDANFCAEEGDSLSLWERDAPFLRTQFACARPREVGCLEVSLSPCARHQTLARPMSTFCPPQVFSPLPELLVPVDLSFWDVPVPSIRPWTPPMGSLSTPEMCMRALPALFGFSPI